MRHKVYYIAATLHLGMVALFAAHFAESPLVDTTVGRTLSVAGNYTGSNNIFSFFAPGLSDQPYVVYTLKDNQGKEKLVDFTGRSAEFTSRINNIYGYLTIPESRTILTASLAQALLNQYPLSKQIRVTMVIQDIPTMEEYRLGRRSRWRFWFNRDFQRK